MNETTGREVKSKGKTVDEAVLSGLSEMGCTIDQVDVQVVQEEKGFLGIGKSAVVLLRKRISKEHEVEEFLDALFVKMGISATAKAEEQDKIIKVEILGDSTGVLIGRRGETLDSLQYLTNLVVNKSSVEYRRIFLDTEDYRAKREKTLISLAKRIAEKVAKTGKSVVLEPMNPYERRILHATLQEHPVVCTISEGKEPYRRVIIKKKKEETHS